ncbi:hypothetical protein L9F63_002114, partial [Diploptera punctata]
RRRPLCHYRSGPHFDKVYRSDIAYILNTFKDTRCKQNGNTAVETEPNNIADITLLSRCFRYTNNGNIGT